MRGRRARRGMTLRLLLAALAASALLAGCVQQAESLGGRIVAHGADPRLAMEWSYDGSALRNAQGTVTIEVNHRTNAGSVTASLDDGRDQWRLDWSDFHESRPFHDGGIAEDFVEHGASGVGDTSVPEVHLVAAGWGEARLYRNGVLVPDPLTGNETLRAHFMIVDGTLRAADGVIYNASRAEPFDPADPGDGLVTEGGNQIFVTLASHETAPPYRFFLVMEFPTVTLGEARESGPIA